MNISYGAKVIGSGLTIERTISRVMDGTGSREIALPAAKAGTLTTRTSASVGTLTLSTGHGITTGMVADLYWSGQQRYSVTVGTVAGNSVPFSLGAGFDLPIQGTAVTICQQKQVNVAIDADHLSILAMEVGYADLAETATAILRFEDASSSELVQLYLTANAPVVIDVTGNNGGSVPGAISPFAGVSDKLFVSHSSSAAAATLKIIWGADSTP